MMLKILTLERPVVEQEVYSVTLPGVLGLMTVLEGHDILVTRLKAGPVTFREASGAAASTVEISTGHAEITHDGVRVFTEAATVLA